MYEVDLIYCQKFMKMRELLLITKKQLTNSCRPLNNVAGHMYQKVEL